MKLRNILLIIEVTQPTVILFSRDTRLDLVGRCHSKRKKGDYPYMVIWDLHELRRFGFQHTPSNSSEIQIGQEIA
jgi:hypothetical protein